MSRHAHKDPEPAPPPAHSRRAFGRLEAEVQSTLGPVIDIGGGGVRVLVKKPPKTRLIEISLFDDTTSVTVDAKVIWARKLGLWRYEIGLAFLVTDDEKTRQLTRLAMTNRLRRVI